MSELTGSTHRVTARLGVVMVLLIAALTAGGCSGSAGTPKAACTTAAPTAVPGHGAGVQPLITVGYQSFWTGRWELAPSIVVYSDGSAIFRQLPDPHGDELRAATPAVASVPPKATTQGLSALQGGYLTACDLDTLIDGIAAVDPPSGDFGAMSQVYDAPGVTLRLTPRAGPPTELSAYALGIDDGGYPVSPAQQAARQRLQAVLDDLDHAFRPTGPAPLDRIRVEVATAGGPGASDEVRPWPGPALPPLLGTHGCGEVTGAAAATLAAAVPGGEFAPAEHLGHWSSDGGRQTLGLVVLPPGVEGCPT